MPVLVNSQNRSLREKMYMAFITRASQGDTDNSEIIEEIRQLRYMYVHHMYNDVKSSANLV